MELAVKVVGFSALVWGGVARWDRDRGESRFLGPAMLTAEACCWTHPYWAAGSNKKGIGDVRWICTEDEQSEILY